MLDGHSHSGMLKKAKVGDRRANVPAWTIGNLKHNKMGNNPQFVIKYSSPQKTGINK